MDTLLYTVSSSKKRRIHFPDGFIKIDLGIETLSFMSNNAKIEPTYCLFTSSRW